MIFVLGIWALAWTAPALGETREVGRVESLEGSVQVERQGQSHAAEAGETVHLLDRWLTGPDSSAEIVFLDGSRMRLTPGTSIEITRYLYDPDRKERESLLSMWSGKARFLVEDLEGFKHKRFEVQTQTAIAGTRDTDFTVWIISDSITRAICHENAITLINLNAPERPVILTANMVSEIHGFNLPSPPRFTTPTEQMEYFRGIERIGPKILPPVLPENLPTGGAPSAIRRGGIRTGKSPREQIRDATAIRSFERDGEFPLRPEAALPSESPPPEEGGDTTTTTSTTTTFPPDPSSTTTTSTTSTTTTTTSTLPPPATTTTLPLPPRPAPPPQLQQRG